MNSDFLEALADLEKEKGIDKEILLEAIEAALISAYRRDYGGSANNVRVEIDRLSGGVRVYSRKTVVEEVEDDTTEVSLGEAREVDPSYGIDDVIEKEVTPKEFGRIAAQTAKQVVVQRIREAERSILYEEFVDREGDILTGIVQRHQGRSVVVDLGRAEGILAPPEQMPNESYRQNDRIKVYIVQVNETTKGPQIVLSRTHPGLLKRIFELEVPEIHDGTVEIRGIAREAGFRSKMAVSSRDENVDAVGSCVGPKGMRVQGAVSELKGEKVDIVKYDSEPSQYIANALSPAKVLAVQLDEEARVARVVVPDRQLSLAIGKEGQNARLAAKLTGWKIDIRSESQVLAAEGGGDHEEEEGAPEDVCGLPTDETQAGTDSDSQDAGGGNSH